MTEINDGFYVMAFYSASHSIQAERLANKLFNLTVIPTPRELTNDCGIAIRFHNCDFIELETFHKTLTVPADLYFLSNEKTNGKRKVKKLS